MKRILPAVLVFASCTGPQAPPMPKDELHGLFVQAVQAQESARELKRFAQAHPDKFQRELAAVRAKYAEIYAEHNGIVKIVITTVTERRNPEEQKAFLQSKRKELAPKVDEFRKTVLHLYDLLVEAKLDTFCGRLQAAMEMTGPSPIGEVVDGVLKVWAKWNEMQTELRAQVIKDLEGYKIGSYDELKTDK